MSRDEEINQLLEEALEKLNLAMQKVHYAPKEERELYNIGTLGMAGGTIVDFQMKIFERRPELQKKSSVEEYSDDPELTMEEREFTSKLSSEKLEEIDNALLSEASKHYRKVARLVASMFSQKEIHVEGIPDIFYAERVRLLVKNGYLESQGNLKGMRFSEVRLINKELTLTT